MIAEKEKWFSLIISVSNTIDCIWHMRRCIIPIARAIGSGKQDNYFFRKSRIPLLFEFAHTIEVASVDNYFPKSHILLFFFEFAHAIEVD